ncbi:hypothetical protein GmHk_02G003853 [Glycine max]|nr:hypothetical protein GmHk_02G003853 [Glycine max]
MRSDTNTSVRGRSSFLLIVCERSSEFKPKKIDLVRTCTDTRKCGCPFKLCAKPDFGGEGWMMKLICGVHNHEMKKSLVGHPYVGRLTKDENIVVADMTNTYKTNRYKLLLLDIVGVTPTGMTFSAAFAYLEGEHFNNVVWALQRFWGLFMRVDALPGVESAHWSLKRLRQNSIGDICSRLRFLDQRLCEAEVTITKEMETILKRFEQLDVCGKVHLKTKLREISYPDLNFMCPLPKKVKTKGAQKNH